MEKIKKGLEQEQNKIKKPSKSFIGVMPLSSFDDKGDGTGDFDDNSPAAERMRIAIEKARQFQEAFGESVQAILMSAGYDRNTPTHINPNGEGQLVSLSEQGRRFVMKKYPEFVEKFKMPEDDKLVWSTLLEICTFLEMALKLGASLDEEVVFTFPTAKEHALRTRTFFNYLKPSNKWRCEIVHTNFHLDKMLAIKDILKIAIQLFKNRKRKVNLNPDDRVIKKVSIFFNNRVYNFSF